MDLGSSFVRALVFFLFFSLPIPFLAYRIYALQRAFYQLSPEGILLNWGLRSEAIPMEKILWLSPDTQLERPLPKPWVRWPGSVIGVRQVSGGEVEYMAAQSDALIVIATPGKMYMISPENPELFLQTFHRQAEIGTLSPIPSRSVYPTFLFGTVWESQPARWMIMTGLMFSLIFLIWITLTPSTHFNGNDSLIVSQTQLFLLPIVNGLFFLANFFLGLFFYRRPQSQPLAYLLWGTSILTSLLFFGALITYLQR